MTTASLRFVLTSGDLTFSGIDDTNPLGLVSMPRVPRQPRVKYADDSDHVEGSLSTSSVWQQSVLTAVVGIRGTDQTSLEASIAALEAALGHHRYVVVTERNGYQQAWTADMGAATPIESGDDEYIALRDFEAGFTLTIPVRPTPEVI